MLGHRIGRVFLLVTGTTVAAGVLSTSVGAVATPSTVPVGDVPAGVQFGAPVEIAPSASIYGEGTTFAGDLYLPASYEGTSNYRGLGPSVVVVHADGTSAAVSIDNPDDLAAPAGHPVDYGFETGSVAASGLGILAAGNSTFWTEANTSATVVGLLWFTTNWTDWQRIDPRDVIGDVPLRIADVAATSDGFLAVGATTTAHDSDDKTSIVVLASADGVTWRESGRIESTWAVSPTEVGVVNDEIVVVGVEYPCSADAENLTTFSTGAQFRLWHSADGGATWTRLTGPDLGVITEPEPAPADATTCPTADALAENAERFQALAEVAAITDRGVIVGGQGSDLLATSSDLTNWTVGTVPHRRATVAEGQTPRDPVASWAGVAGTDLVLLALEYRRDADNGDAYSDAVQVYSWRSSDLGVTWVEQPRGRPFLREGAVAFVPFATDGFALIETANDGTVGPARLRPSVAGPYEQYQVCAPAPGAGCSFAESFTIPPSGTDLSGIDLRGATIGADVSLAGTTLAGARLDEATVGAVLTGADLSGASLDGADLGDSDLTGATLTGATLSDTDVNETLFAAADWRSAVLTGVNVEIREPAVLTDLDLAGLDLTGATIASYGEVPASLAGLSLAGTTIDGMYFAGVDLTGVDLSTAVFDPETGEPYFFDTICPDGQPADDAVFGLAGCRLG